MIVSLKIKKRLRQILSYRQALQSLEKASNYEQVRAALNKLAQLKKWENNLTLDEFLDHWKQQYNNEKGKGKGRRKARIKDSGKNLEVTIQQLQAYQFSKHTNKQAIKHISKALLKAIKS